MKTLHLKATGEVAPPIGENSDLPLEVVAANSTWWSNLSDDAKKRYLERHPKSKYKLKTKRKRKTPASSGKATKKRSASGKAAPLLTEDPSKVTKQRRRNAAGSSPTKKEAATKKVVIEPASVKHRPHILLKAKLKESAAAVANAFNIGKQQLGKHFESAVKQTLKGVEVVGSRLHPKKAIAPAVRNAVFALTLAACFAAAAVSPDLAHAGFTMHQAVFESTWDRVLLQNKSKQDDADPDPELLPEEETQRAGRKVKLNRLGLDEDGNPVDEDNATLSSSQPSALSVVEAAIKEALAEFMCDLELGDIQAGENEQAKFKNRVSRFRTQFNEV